MFFFNPTLRDVAALLAWCSMNTGVSAVSLKVAAIQPTTSGQIGVNLVDPIPSPSALVGQIGKNTEYLTDIGGTTTSWIGPDPSFITQTTLTVTNTAGAVATVTTGASVVVTEDSNGDISILIGPALRASLIDIATTISPCAAKKRSAACGLTGFVEAVAQSGPITEIAQIENAMPLGRLVIPATDIAQLVAVFKAYAAAVPPVAVGGGTLGLLYLLYDEWNSNRDISPVMDLPSSVIGTTTTATATATATACPGPSDEPICPDDDCLGDDSMKCTVGDNEGCPCLGIDNNIPGIIPTEFIGLHSLVEAITLSTASSPVPMCFDNNEVGIETNLWKAIVTNVCASQPLSADINAIQNASDVGFPGYDGWSFALTWQYGEGDCDFGCEEMFDGFLGSTQCSYDSHHFSGSGNNTQACGTASFVVNQPVVAPQPTLTPATSTPVGPALGVPTCGTGQQFQRSDAADSATTFCKQLAQAGSWAQGRQNLTFPNVQVYNRDGTLSSGSGFGISVNALAIWCPAGLTLDDLAKTMTVDRCFADMMIAIDGCAPFVATNNEPFLKTAGSSQEDCMQFIISAN